MKEKGVPISEVAYESFVVLHRKNGEFTYKKTADIAVSYIKKMYVYRYIQLIIYITFIFNCTVFTRQRLMKLLLLKVRMQIRMTSL